MKLSLRQTLLPLILLFSVGYGSAQNLIFFQKTDSKSYLVKYRGGNESQAITDYFIQTLSQGNGKSLYQTEFILVHDQFMRATKTSPTSYQLYTTIQGLRISGDTRYRGLDVSELLKPSTAKFTLERVDAQGRVKDSWDFSSVPLTTDPAVVANFPGVDTVGNFENHTFRFRDFNFIYQPADKTPFAVRTTLIDEYYASIQDLEEIYRKLKDIDPNDIEELNVSESDVRKLRSRIEAIRDKGFEQKLGLSLKLDPAGYLTRFQEADTYAAELSTRIEDNKANLHRLYYERGVASLEKGDRPNAIVALETAIKMQPSYAPAHMAMARLRYKEGNLDAASDGLLNIFNNLRPSPEVRTEAVTLAGTIYQNRLGNATYAIQQKRLEDGLVELDAASALCEGIPEVTCTDQRAGLYRQAHAGMFNRLTANAQKSLESGNAEQAINEAHVARQYAVQHTPYVLDTTQVLPILNEAYRIQFQQILAGVEVLLQNNDLDGAEQQLADAKAFRAAHMDALPDPGALVALENKVAGRRYTWLIVQGKDLASQSKWGPALAEYEKAIALEQAFPLQRDSLLPQLALSTAKLLLKTEISRALELARSNRLTDARNMRLAIDEVRKRYALQDDPDIDPPYEEMKKVIFDKECANAQGELDELVALAERDIRALDYLDAKANFKAALEVDARNNRCGLAVQTAKEGLVRIAPAVEYQQNLKNIKTSIERALFREAVTNYLQATEDFERGDIGNKFNLRHASLFDYLQKSGNDEFVKYGVEHFTDEKDYDSAIRLLKDLLRRGYSKGRLKPLMVRIGQALSVRDFQQDPSTDPKVKGLTYTDGDRGLKKLYKAYRKQWKKMD